LGTREANLEGHARLDRLHGFKDSQRKAWHNYFQVVGHRRVDATDSESMLHDTGSADRLDHNRRASRRGEQKRHRLQPVDSHFTRPAQPVPTHVQGAHAALPFRRVVARGVF
jgi:hypothetical protein